MITSKEISDVLNKSLPKKFEFIDGVKDVLFVNNEFITQLKIKIILNKFWVSKNFSAEALQMVEQDYEKYSHVLLSPFVMEVYSNDKVDVNEVESYIETIMDFCGIKKPQCDLSTSYYID